MTAAARVDDMAKKASLGKWAATVREGHGDGLNGLRGRRNDRKGRHRKITKQRRYERVAATSQLFMWQRF